jgi:hypothetical protein
MPLPIIRPQTAVVTGTSGPAVALAVAFERFGAPRTVGRIKELLAAKSDVFGSLLDELSGLARRRLVGLGEGGPDPAIVLSLDQAEELFNAEGASEAATFLELLATILAPSKQSQTRKILVLATDDSLFTQHEHGFANGECAN